MSKSNGKPYIFHTAKEPPTYDPYQAFADAIAIRAFKDYADAMYKLEGIEKPVKPNTLFYYQRLKKSCEEYFESELYANTTDIDYKPILERWREIER